MGLSRATDVIGGVDAWLAAGLPTTTVAPGTGSESGERIA